MTAPNPASDATGLTGQTADLVPAQSSEPVEPAEIFELNFQVNTRTIRKPAAKAGGKAAAKPAPLLPQQPEPIDRVMLALSRRFLYPAEKALMSLFLELRAELDESYGRHVKPRYGKPYPYGFCREITFGIIHLLRLRLEARDKSPGVMAINSFLQSGGRLRCVWGVLRDSFFQTAMQLGDLYIDVANDTVTITKPKVEILPMGQSGLEAVRDLEHYLDLARRYWQVEIYANDILPGIASFAPVIMYRSGAAPQFQPIAQYMVEMALRDGFKMAEKFLETAAPPPPELVQMVTQALPTDMLQRYGGEGRQAAVATCQSARAAGLAKNREGRVSRIRDLILCNEAIAKPGSRSAQPQG